MKRTGPTATLVIGVLAFGLAALFVSSFQPLESIGRSGLPAIVIEVALTVGGIACVISGLYRLRRKGK